ncbi:MAG: tetratricopeptide repeat protein [Microcella sp.]|uniref:tetratricopeptide repeat protein n=1 Tax=Microcella sp. TaxID=1913979 RepID=UPI0024C91FA8|nr:tetratricopeptide repeat protein [Microcella sp.]UYN84761.1 MAG: tetratricopeptide repeat protein [Microcella sp.]
MSDARLNGAALRGAVDLSSLVRAAQSPHAPAGAPPAGASPAAPQSAVVREIDDSSFAETVELSRTVPVIVEFFAEGIAPSLGALIASYGGRLVLATVDGNRSPQLAQAFQVQQVPAVAAIIGGRPMQLFVGMPSEPEVRQVLDQVLEVAAQNGVTGTVSVDDAEAGVEPAEEPLPPLHQQAFDAISEGDYAAAATAYRTAIAQNPRDQLAVAGLAQVSLLQRLDGLDAAAVRAAAAAEPSSVDAQLAVADLDLSGGHVDDAFARLLRIFAELDAEGKAAVRTRLLDYFEIVGADDERTIAARRALTALLF